MRKFIMRRIRDPEREKAFSFVVFFSGFIDYFCGIFPGRIKSLFYYFLKRFTYERIKDPYGR